MNTVTQTSNAPYNIKSRYGETALITGASSGIGKGFARALAKEGMNLILTARRQAELNELANTLESEFGINTQVIAIDLLDPHAADALLATAKWPVDLLINNAGYGSFGEFDRLDRATEEKMVDLNCRQVVSLTHNFIPHMKQQKKGAVIFLASVVSHIPAPYMATYSATKAFNRYFALSVAGELSRYHVDVLALCPGDTVSEFRDQAEFHKPMPLPPRSVEDVVHTALNTLGKKMSVIDGLANKLSAALGKIWPENRIVKFNAKIWRPKSVS